MAPRSVEAKVRNGVKDPAPDRCRVGGGYRLPGTARRGWIGGRTGGPPEPCRQDQATPTIDREVRPQTTAAQHQHALAADGLNQHLSAGQMLCADREGDPSDRLHTDGPVPPLRDLRLAAQLD